MVLKGFVLIFIHLYSFFRVDLRLPFRIIINVIEFSFWAKVKVYSVFDRIAPSPFPQLLSVTNRIPFSTGNTIIMLSPNSQWMGSMFSAKNRSFLSPFHSIPLETANKLPSDIVLHVRWCFIYSIVSF